MTTKNRYGRFLIDWYVIENNPEDVKLVLRGILITRAESIHYRQAVLYHGISDAFEEIEISRNIPLYEVQLYKDENGVVSVSGWKKSEFQDV